LKREDPLSTDNSGDRIAATSVATHSTRAKQVPRISSFERGESRGQVQDVE